MDRLRQEERTLGDLFGDLSVEVRTLVQQEIALARAEIRREVSQYTKDAVSIAIGGALAWLGAQALVATVIIALALVLPWWLSALIVGIVLGVAGYLLIQRGLNDMKERSPVPEQTLETLKEDREWLKNQLS